MKQEKANCLIAKKNKINITKIHHVTLISRSGYILQYQIK